MAGLGGGALKQLIKVPAFKEAVGEEGQIYLPPKPA